MSYRVGAYSDLVLAMVTGQTGLFTYSKTGV